MSPEAAIAIARTLYDYAWTLDRDDWPALVRLFADRAEMDFLGTTGVVVGGEKIASELRRIRINLDRTQHVIHNVRADIREDLDKEQASVTACYEANHVALERSPEPFTVGGIYHVEVEREAATWSIVRIRPEVVWTRGNVSVLGAAGRLAREVGAR